MHAFAYKPSCCLVPVQYVHYVATGLWDSGQIQEAAIATTVVASAQMMMAAMSMLFNDTECTRHITMQITICTRHE